MKKIEDKVKGISIELDKNTKLNELDEVILDFEKNTDDKHEVDVSVDIQNMKEIKGAFFIHKSITELEENDFEEFKEKVPFDLVLSDMAPNISGIRETDDAQMIYLVENILSVIDKFLKKGGSTLIKVFQGESLDYTRNALSDRFKTCKVNKPIASRSNSKETYVIGKEFK